MSIEPTEVAADADQAVITLTVRLDRLGRSDVQIQRDLLAHTHSVHGYSAASAAASKVSGT
jgi:hypothetical protein